MSHEVSPIFLIGEWRSRGLIKIQNGAFGIKVGARLQYFLFEAGQGGR